MPPHWVLFVVVLLTTIAEFVQPIGKPLPAGHGKSKGMEGRIVGGVVSRKNQFPYLIAITSIWKNIMCGGSLISENLVLTAAHCLCEDGTSVAEDTSNMVLVAGEHNLQKTEEGFEQYAEVNRVVVHKDYDPLNYLNDIALVELALTSFTETESSKNPFKFKLTDGVATIKLATAHSKYHKSNCSVAGWGYAQEVTEEDHFKTKLEFPKTLQFVELDIIEKDKCSKIGWNKVAAADPGVICVGHLAGGKGSCNGDSGGPFVCPSISSGEPLQVGIVSSGSGCAMPNSPVLYTNVAYMEPWIKKARVALSDGTKDAGGFIRI